MSPLSFDNGWIDRNANCCVNIDDDFSTSDKNFGNSDPVVPEIFLLICVGELVSCLTNKRYFIEIKAKGQYWPLTCVTNHNTMFNMVCKQ